MIIIKYILQDILTDPVSSSFFSGNKDFGLHVHNSNLEPPHSRPLTNS